MIAYQDYLDAIPLTPTGYLPLSANQQAALQHTYTVPLWMIAGPGTGKTHTLVWLVLKRLLVDGIPPQRIILTTFTRKAAAELRRRLVLAHRQLVDNGLAAAAQVDVTQVRLGTLHGLCQQILREERYAPVQHVRLLADERTQAFFLRRSRNPIIDVDNVAFWDHFQLATYLRGIPYTPPKAVRADRACQLLGRIAENQIDPVALGQSTDAHLVTLAAGYTQYVADLADWARTDQAHLQRHFLDFLGSPEGQHWLGDGYTVLVDEYQDTNPVQEAIYFTLAAGTNGGGTDLTVVGDDDQSLYRFRGATVESLIDFDTVCQHYLGCTPQAVYLAENRRSHDGIVGWCNRFIQHHPAMQPGTPPVRVRAPGKPALVPMAGINGAYAPVQVLHRGGDAAAAMEVAESVQFLRQHGYITDYSQVAFLTFSTKENKWAIQDYVAALVALGIPYVNPRNKAAHRDDLLLALVGSLSYILDEHYRYNGHWPHPTGGTFQLPQALRRYIDRARQAFDDLIDDPAYTDLRDYADASVDAVRNAPVPDPSATLEHAGGQPVTPSDLLYKLLAHEPFASTLSDAVSGERLKVFSQILGEYESLFYDGRLRLETAADPQDPNATISRIAQWTLYNFYAVCIEGFHDGLDDPVDEEVSVQPGAVNVMTVHQAKGLQFEVVFVLKPGNTPFVGSTHRLEDLLAPFVNRPVTPAARSDAERSQEDVVRLFFVAYSRAKRLLVLAGPDFGDWPPVLGAHADGTPVRTDAHLQALGVTIL